MSRFFALRPGEARWVFGGSVAFAFLAADVATGGLLDHFDHVVREQIQPRAPVTPWWMGLPGDVGEAGIAAGLVVAAALVTSQVLWRGWPMLLALGNLVAVEVMTLLVKTAIGRPGPGEVVGTEGYPGFFPSGHASTSAVCVGTVVFLVATWGRPRRLDIAAWAGQLGGLGVGAVSALRSMLEDFHWLTDGVGGLLVASVTMTLGFAAARRYVGTALVPGGVEPP